MKKVDGGQGEVSPNAFGFGVLGVLIKDLLRTTWILAIAMVAFLVFSTGSTYAAIEVSGTVSTGSTEQTQTMTISHTTPSGSNRLMIVGVSLWNNNDETVTGVTYNGVALSSLTAYIEPSCVYAQFWYMVAPDVGTYNVVVTFSEEVNKTAVAGVMTFTGVDQTNPLGTVTGNNGVSGTASVTGVSSATGELVIDVVSGLKVESFTATSPQQERWNLSCLDEYGAGSTRTGATTVGMSWTLGASDCWAITAVSIKPAAAALDVSGSDVSSDMLPNTTNNEMLSIQLVASEGTITVTDMIFDFSGTADAADFLSSGIKLWNDDGSTIGTYDGTESQVTTSQDFGASVTFSSMGYAVTTTIRNLLLTVDIAVGANTSHTLAATLQDNTHITVTGGTVNSFSAIGTVDCSLPVELSAFTVTAGDGKVALNWTTESEIENLGFNIYRSTNSYVKFLMINDELISNAGNSSQRHDYEYVDKGLTNGVTYWYKLEDVDYSGNTKLHGPVSATPIESAFPAEFRLYPNYPNPFNPVTTISYDLPDEGLVELTVYNMRGEKVTTLMQGKQTAGSYKLNWDGTDRNGEKVSSGIYILRIASGSYSRTSKMVFIR